MRIPQCHGQSLMSQELSDRWQIYACHDEVTGKRMPEIVEGEIFDAGPLAGRLKPFLDVPESLASAICEHVETVYPPDQALQGSAQGIINRDFPARIIFGLVQENKPMFQIDVFVPTQGEDFFPAHTRV